MDGAPVACRLDSGRDAPLRSDVRAGFDADSLPASPACPELSREMLRLERVAAFAGIDSARLPVSEIK